MAPERFIEDRLFAVPNFGAVTLKCLLLSNFEIGADSQQLAAMESFA